jgi:AcrR family transcriptional regulator
MVSKQEGTPMPKPRARQEEQKLERRQAILTIARVLFEETPFQALTMAQVADRAGLAKGTLYLYFKSKEELFLALLEDELAEWFHALDRTLAAQPAGLPPGRLAGLIRRSLESRPLLLRLLGILHAVLEQNVEPERVLAFKRMLLAAMATTGAELERVLPHLTEGQGMHLIVRANALVVGLQQVAMPSPMVAAAMREDPALAVFELDFAQELEVTLTALIAGMERSGGTDEQPRVERKNRAGHGRFERPWG